MDAAGQCEAALNTIHDIADYNQLMGLEGTVAKTFFSAYFQHLGWNGRHPRMKTDIMNVTLDIGYTILFNFMECFIRMFGFRPICRRLPPAVVQAQVAGMRPYRPLQMHHRPCFATGFQQKAIHRKGFYVAETRIQAEA